MTDEPQPGARPARRPAEAALAVACGLLLALNVAVFATRLASVLRAHPLYITEGAEGPTIYPVWKAQAGHPVYEPAYAPPHAITWYNFLFYHVYAILLNLLGARDGGMLLPARMITLALGVVGAIGFRLVVRRLAAPEGRGFALAATALAIVAWLGTNYMAWWVFSIRPDAGGAALLTWGLLAFLWASARRSMAGMVVASALFFSAWAFKQSLVCVLFSVCLYTLARRDWRLLFPLALPCAAGMALTFAVLGRDYWENTIVAPTRSAGIDLRQSAAIFARIFAQNAFFWLYPFVPPALRLLTRGRATADGTEAPGAGALWLALPITFAFGFAALGHEGSNKNHVIEYYVVTSALALVALRRVLAMPEGRARTAGLALAVATLAPMVAFPAAQLAAPRSFGRIRLADAAEYAARERLARAVGGLEKPVLIFDDILAQPWHASDDRYPTFVPDLNWFLAGKAPLLFEGGGAAPMIRRHAFRSLLLTGGMPAELEAAREAGYVEVPDPPEAIRAAGLKLLVLREDAPR